MTNNQSYFDKDFIGQEPLKRAISFNLDVYKKTRIFTPSLLTGVRGFGKTTTAHVIGKNLIGSNGKPKEFIEVGGPTLKGVQSFIDTVVKPEIDGDKEVTIFIDEIAESSNDIKNFLLQILNTRADGTSYVSHNRQEFWFKNTFVTWIAATTNPEKLPKPLLDRFLSRYEFEPYSLTELSEILTIHTPGVAFASKNGDEGRELKENISLCSRGNPRLIFSLGGQIKRYCDSQGIAFFDDKDWKQLRYVLNIQPYGLLPNEILELYILSTCGPSRLNLISSKLNIDPGAVRMEVEHYLLQNGLITIDNVRFLTQDGLKVLRECDLTKIQNRFRIK